MESAHTAQPTYFISQEAEDFSPNTIRDLTGEHLICSPGTPC